MKKLVLLLCVFCLACGVVSAKSLPSDRAKSDVEFYEPIAYFNIGNLEFTIPIKNNVELVALYDIWHGQGLLGGETVLVRLFDFNMNFGAVSSYLGLGTPYLSLDYDFARTNPKLFKIGGFGGYDFEIDEWRVGVKASKKFL